MSRRRQPKPNHHTIDWDRAAAINSGLDPEPLAPEPDSGRRLFHEEVRRRVRAFQQKHGREPSDDDLVTLRHETRREHPERGGR
jgi:hypothetical protein